MGERERGTGDERYGKGGGKVYEGDGERDGEDGDGWFGVV